MPKKEFKNIDFYNIDDVLDFLSKDDSGNFDDSNGNAGFSSNESYNVKEDLTTVARSLSLDGSDYMMKIAAMAIGYDKASNFDRAKEILSVANRETNFKRRIQKMSRAYSISLTTKEPNEAINDALRVFFSSYGNGDDILKQAQDVTDPKFVAEKIFEIINIMLARMKFESRPKSKIRIREKIFDFDAIELSNKKSPGGAAVGVALALIKNILIARDTFFINRVLEELNIMLR